MLWLNHKILSHQDTGSSQVSGHSGIKAMTRVRMSEEKPRPNKVRKLGGQSKSRV